MAIDFRWGQSGTSNFSLGTSASVSAGTINTINQNDLLIAVVVPTAIAVLGPDGKQVIDPVTGLPEVTADPGPVAVPDGWTQLDNTALLLDGYPADAAIFYKIADGSESTKSRHSVGATVPLVRGPSWTIQAWTPFTRSTLLWA